MPKSQGIGKMLPINVDIRLKDGDSASKRCSSYPVRAASIQRQLVLGVCSEILLVLNVRLDLVSLYWDLSKLRLKFEGFGHGR